MKEGSQVGGDHGMREGVSEGGREDREGRNGGGEAGRGEHGMREGVSEGGRKDREGGNKGGEAGRGRAWHERGS